jgi:hypothetical protein
MKKVILATFALCTLLFIACNSESSGKNNTAPNNEMEHMETDAQHNETDHMTSGEVHEEHAMLNVKSVKTAVVKCVKIRYEDDISKAAAAGHDTDYKAEQAVFAGLLQIQSDYIINILE